MPALLIQIILIFVALSVLLILLHEEARRMILEQREHERRAMLGILSHRIRTPLTSIKWHAEMLLGGDAGTPTESQRKLLEEINEGDYDILHLLNRFLDISRMKRGGAIAQPIIVNVHAAVLKVFASQKQLFKEKHQKCHIQKTGSGEMRTFLDAHLLHGVLDTLLSNATRYTPEGGSIDITISRRARSVVVRVTDTGVGIPLQEQPKIFTEFFRGEQAKLLYPGGCGLGLALAKILMEQSRGSLTFTSEEGKGTTFVLTLPRVERR